jgi:formylglycine-generating enzyme required for sulfatase activity
MNRKLVLTITTLTVVVGLFLSACGAGSPASGAEEAPPEGIPSPPMATALPTETPTATLEPLAHPISSPPTPTLGIGSTQTRPTDRMVMVYIPAGEFTMISETDADDAPVVQTVYLDAYWIDQTEVTNSMYALCVADGACDPPNSSSSYTRANYYENSEYDDYPVIFVSWEAADTYCAWADARLPAEAEWEKAAHGTDGRTYPWGNTFPSCSLLNYWGDNDGCIGDTSIVGNYEDGQSPYGAYDMAGNVWEWVADWYDAYPGDDPSASDSFGQTYRVLRGGSWGNNFDYARSADRSWDFPTFSSYFVGFRCSRDTAP